MQVGVLIIGDEILDGLIEDSNGPYISRFLSMFGSEVMEKIEVRDDEKLILESLNFLISFCEGVFLCGGLGPTEDDKTREAIASFTNRKLVFDEKVWNYIETKLKERGREPLPAHKKMAYVPEGAVIFENSVGLAPAFLCEKEGKFIIALPGVPQELKTFLPQICNYLFMKRGDKMLKIFKTFGLKESQVNELAKKALSGLDIKWGTILKDSEVWINVKLDKNDLDLVNSRLKETFGLYLYGEDDETLEGLIGKLLKKEGLTLSVAESCTGGLLSNLITNISGSSDYFKGGVVSYLEEIKNRVLQVKEEDIKKYTVYSHEVAKQMAEGVRKLMNSDISLSTTGIAGPTGGTPENPVGTVYVGISTNEFTRSFRFNFNYDRLGNKMAFAKAALDILRRYLIKDASVCSH